MANYSMKKITVAMDGSEESKRAADMAISIASKYEASLTVLYVRFPPDYMLYPELSVPPPAPPIPINIETAERVWLAEVQEKAKAKHIQFNEKLITSTRSPQSEIVDYADADKSDLIVIGTKGRSGFKKILLGSVASGVVTYSSCPVMVVR